MKDVVMANIENDPTSPSNPPKIEFSMNDGICTLVNKDSTGSAPTATIGFSRPPRRGIDDLRYKYE